MTSTDAGLLSLTVERVQPAVAARGNGQTYAVARVEGAATATRVLTIVPGVDVSTLQAHAAQCIRIEEGLSAEAALHAPALALSLWAWEQLQLELGEAAVYTADSPFQHFLGEAALLRGALQVIQLGHASGYTPPKQVQVLTIDESGSLIAQLKGRLADSVGGAAIDVSGKAEVTDVIFETLPRWGRLMLAAHRTSPINIDFYNNVHRKGIDLRACSFDPLQVFETALRVDDDVFVRRAMALLMRRPELVLTKRTDAA